MHTNMFMVQSNEIIKKNFLKLVFLVTFYIVGQTTLGGVILYSYAEYINNQISKNIEEYNEIDFEQLCKISICSALKVNNTVFKENNGLLTKHSVINDNFIFGNNIGNNIYVNTDLKLVIYNKDANAYFVLNVVEINQLILKGSVYFTTLLFVVTLIVLIFSILSEKQQSLRILAGHEALLTNKSMILITENIHHELNTPMEVIDNKVHKIQKIIKNIIIENFKSWEKYEEEHSRSMNFEEYKKKEKRSFNTQLLKIDEDFEYIKQSSEAIYVILERMRGFKHLRYSNGNKSIANIVEGAFKIISVSKTNFEYSLDPNLKNFSIQHESFKNADLLNILINHIKNSLEANSNKIHVAISSIESNFIKIRIIDNGNGIPKDALKTIFVPNFSTKSIDQDGIRGNGLFINKEIIKSANGDIKLINTSKYGTAFELKIPVKSRI